jgi:hypothetical protein
MRPAVASSIEVGAEVSDRVDRPQQRHRERPRKEERAERVDAKRHAVDGSRPAPHDLQRLAAPEDGEHAREHEHAGQRLRSDRRRAARQVRAQAERQRRTDEQHGQAEEQRDRHLDAPLPRKAARRVAS